MTSYSGRNDFILRAKRLSVRAKRLRAKRISGETTCFRFTAMISAKLRRHVSSAVSHNMRIADGSGNWNKKCCTVVAWWEQHSDPSRSFEHRAKNQTAAFKSGTRLDLKHLAVAQNCVNSQHSIRSTWFSSGRCILNNQRVCIFLKSYSLAEKSPLRPKSVLFVMILKRKIGDQRVPSLRS